VERLGRLTEIANGHARPWFEKLQPRNNYLYPEFDEIHYQAKKAQEMLIPEELPISGNFQVT